MQSPGHPSTIRNRITGRTIDEVESVASVLLAILAAHLLGATHVSWAAYAGYMVMRGHVADTQSRGLLRIAGTATGGLMALGLAPMLSDNAPGAALALLLMGTASLYATLTARRAYGWLFMGLTFAMVLLDKIERPDIALATFVETRILETIAGTVACMVVSLLSTLTLRRYWPAERMAAITAIGWHADAFRLALQGGLALALLPLLNLLYPLPAISQSAITIMAVLLVPLQNAGVGGVRRRIRDRFIGCIAGALIAALFLFIAQGSPIILILGTVIGVVLGRHLENSTHPLRYAGMQLALTILVILVPDSYADASMEPGTERFLGIVLGMVLLEPMLLLWGLLSPAKVDEAETDSKSADI